MLLEIDWFFQIQADAIALRVERGDADYGIISPAATVPIAAEYGVNKSRFFVAPGSTTSRGRSSRPSAPCRNAAPTCRSCARPDRSAPSATPAEQVPRGSARTPVTCASPSR